MDKKLYSSLSDMGFRRSGDFLYRPHCRACNACIPARIPVNDFKPSRQQKRVLRKNGDLQITQTAAQYSDEHYNLYKNYIVNKHADGDMFPPSAQQYESFLLSRWTHTVFFEFRLNSRLIAVAATDVMNNGLSAVYTFYDLAESKRSLGVMGILWQIQAARKLGLPAVDLGYWIKNCQKMNYKKAYQPLEVLQTEGWERLQKEALGNPQLTESDDHTDFNDIEDSQYDQQPSFFID